MLIVRHLFNESHPTTFTRATLTRGYIWESGHLYNAQLSLRVINRVTFSATVIGS